MRPAACLRAVSALRPTAARVGATPAEILAALVGPPAEVLAGLGGLWIAPPVVLLLRPLVTILDAASVLRVVLPLGAIASLALLCSLGALTGDVRPVHVF